MAGSTDTNEFFPFLKSLSKEDLQRLLDNDSHQLDNMVKDLNEVKSLILDREMLMASNRSLAEHNISREPRLRSGRERLAQLYQEMSVLNEDFKEGQTKLGDLSRQVSLDTTLALLQTEAAQSEEQAETVAELFLEGGMTSNEFVKQFTERKTEAHMKRIKSEKMAEMIQQKQQQPPQLPPRTYQLSSSSQPQAAPRTYQPASSTQPYPTPSQAPVQMPMPTLYKY